VLGSATSPPGVQAGLAFSPCCLGRAWLCRLGSRKGAEAPVLHFVHYRPAEACVLLKSHISFENPL
jgi:hypothetical protein